MLIRTFADAFEVFEREAFRLELLPCYDVPQDHARYRQYLAGEPLPSAPKQFWIDYLGRMVTSGRHVRRVHVLPACFTPYLRYEIEWGYLYSAQAGEEIYLLPDCDYPSIVGTAQVLDFWLFDDRIAFNMHYDAEGHFLDAMATTDEAEVRRLVKIKQTLLQVAMPLRQWLARERAK